MKYLSRELNQSSLGFLSSCPGSSLILVSYSGDLKHDWKQGFHKLFKILDLRKFRNILIKIFAKFLVFLTSFFKHFKMRKWKKSCSLNNF